MTSFALLLSGFSIFCAFSLALTHFCSASYQGQAMSRVMGLVLLLALSVALAACTPRSGRTAHGGHESSLRREQALAAGSAALLPRADPGYLQWLERQSMLGSTQELTGQVSGTDLIWRNSKLGHAVENRRDPVLILIEPNEI